MPQHRLTHKTLRALKPGAKEQVLGDGGGLWLRVLPQTSGGAFNFYYRFSFNGKERRYNCGSYPETTLAQARQRRDRARELVSQGLDPVEQDATEKAANTASQARQKAEKTVEELFYDWKAVYLAAHRNDGGKDVENLFKRDVFPEIGAVKARKATLQDVVRVIDRILRRNARRTANLALSSMRQMFRHGMGRGIVDTDPTLAMTKKQAGGTASPVTRNLSLHEIGELAAKLPGSGLPARLQAALWLLLATGARVGELSASQWTHFNRSTATWGIPAENSKNGRAHVVHLSKFALKQLDVLEDAREGDYVLAGRNPGTPLNDKTLTKAVRDRIRPTPLAGRTDKTGSLTLSGGEWSVHDLRRTFASRLGDMDVAPHVIERCLNHVQGGIVKVYQQQEYLPERKAALDDWGIALGKLTKPAKTSRKKPLPLAKS